MDCFITAGHNLTKRNARLQSDVRRLSKRGGESALRKEKKKKNYFFFSTQKIIFFLSLALRTWPVAAKRHQSLVSLPAAATVVALAAPVVVAAAAVVEVALTSATTAC